MLLATAVGMAGNLKGSHYCWLLEYWELSLHKGGEPDVKVGDPCAA